jgi:hypothetical protein
VIFKSKGGIFWLDYRFWQLLSIVIIVLKLIFEMLSCFFFWRERNQKFWSWDMAQNGIWRRGDAGEIFANISKLNKKFR